jgi:hypothetical protein
MSIPRNLGNFADNVDANGQVSLTTGVTGTIPVANGGTGQTTYTNGQLLIGNTTGNTLAKANLTAGTGVSVTNGAGSVTLANTGVTSIVAGTNITISGSTGAVTVNAAGGSAVTSVATGNGLSGGTITSTGTLVVACPSWGSVGSYIMGGQTSGGPTITFNADTNYAAGSGTNQMKSAAGAQGENARMGTTTTNNLSGTWKWMSSSVSVAAGEGTAFPMGILGLACRVS